MPPVTVAILLHPPGDDPPLTAALREAQSLLALRHAALFERAGASVVVERRAGSFGSRLGRHAASAGGGLVVLGGGAVPLLSFRDAARLVAAAGSRARVALTNNRYSSDVCAISRARDLPAPPPLGGDNAVPRWLSAAGWAVEELTARERLALDLDSPSDVVLVALARGAPAAVRASAARSGHRLPRLDELRAAAADPRRELLVFGRSSSRALRWLERNLPCRVRFLAEERGVRASGPLPATAIDASARPPRATLGRLLALRGADAFAQIVAELGDAAVIDTRVLLADRLGADEAAWPSAEDRFASDLLRHESIADPWLRGLTAAASRSRVPILLGGHTLVGPGLQLVLKGAAGSAAQARRRGPQAR